MKEAHRCQSLSWNPRHVVLLRHSDFVAQSIGQSGGDGGQALNRIGDQPELTKSKGPRGKWVDQ